MEIFLFSDLLGDGARYGEINYKVILPIASIAGVFLILVTVAVFIKKRCRYKRNPTKSIQKYNTEKDQRQENIENGIERKNDNSVQLRDKKRQRNSFTNSTVATVHAAMEVLRSSTEMVNCALRKDRARSLPPLYTHFKNAILTEPDIGHLHSVRSSWPQNMAIFTFSTELSAVSLKSSPRGSWNLSAVNKKHVQYIRRSYEGFPQSSTYNASISGNTNSSISTGTEDISISKENVAYSATILRSTSKRHRHKKNRLLFRRSRPNNHILYIQHHSSTSSSASTGPIVTLVGEPNRDRQSHGCYSDNQKAGQRQTAATSSLNNDTSNSSHSHENVIAGPDHDNLGAEPNSDNAIAGPSHDYAIAGANHDNTIAGASQDNAIAGASQDKALAGASHDNAIAGASHDNAIAGASQDNAIAGASQDNAIAGASPSHDNAIAGASHAPDSNSSAESDSEQSGPSTFFAGPAKCVDVKTFQRLGYFPPTSSSGSDTGRTSADSGLSEV